MGRGVPLSGPCPAVSAGSGDALGIWVSEDRSAADGKQATELKRARFYPRPNASSRHFSRSQEMLNQVHYANDCDPNRRQKQERYAEYDQLELSITLLTGR